MLYIYTGYDCTNFFFAVLIFNALFLLITRYIAVTHGKQVQVWVAPGHTKEFAPFVLHRTYTGHYDDNTCIDWSADSRYHFFSMDIISFPWISFYKISKI
jgi:hypothetical protein